MFRFGGKMIGMTALGIIVCFFFMYWTYFKYKRGELLMGETILWFIIWIGIAILALFPQMFTYIAKILDIGRDIDLMLIFGVLVCLGLLFYLYLLCRRNERNITRLMERIK